ncbi:RNA polymerase sigma factor [Larkinella punicea]|uniref:Sigma-70 family RNA polymerase sigma factor n=1 Tax=Larkinella punicea TaxID=2315727 RepID=A0A368JQL4_9BACT|nr:sigma-70 family RNA polymerase sigma factor [Larkinella punicea]RCR68461.1 sigma-70 family RNA polymerase sigma factor [Larkinella punicea]
MAAPEKDHQLWHDLKSGDKSALEQIYHQHFEALGKYGLRIIPDAELVEDAIQDVFLNLWRRKEHLSDVVNIKFYLFRTLRNQLSRNIRNDIFEGSEDVNNFLDYLSTISSEQQSISNETREATTRTIQHALSQLSNRQREAIHLRFYQGLSLDETAAMMDVSKQVVKNMLGRAYAVLRISLRTMISLMIFLGFRL